MSDDLGGEDTLIRDDGTSFADDLERLRSVLSDFDNDQRTAFRDSNADAIASHGAPRVLIVAGPGSGKSTLFMARVQHWLRQHESGRIYVTSFVRKLVRDLQTDIEQKIPEEHRDRVLSLAGRHSDTAERTRRPARPLPWRKAIQPAHGEKRASRPKESL